MPKSKYKTSTQHIQDGSPPKLKPKPKEDVLSLLQYLSMKGVHSRHWRGRATYATKQKVVHATPQEWDNVFKTY